MAAVRARRVFLIVVGAVFLLSLLYIWRDIHDAGGSEWLSQGPEPQVPFADVERDGRAAAWKGYDKNGEVELMRAGMVALVRNSELDGMRNTIRQIDDRFNRNYHYPYILLNDVDFTPEFKKKILATTRAPVYFGKLASEQWGRPKHIPMAEVNEALERNKDRYIYGGSYSYRLMCRFQSGFVHKHSLLQNLDFYWRIEPDVSYYCDIPYDPFRLMKQNGYKYGYTITPMEKAETVKTLWNATRSWMLENPHLLPEKSFLPWIVNEDSEYTLCHFWSNFEIVDLSLYRSEAYESYFQHLDRLGGFFYERWGDAPIHSIAASMLLRKDQIHWFEDIGYHHPGYTHCPNSPKMLERCVCPTKNKNDFMYRSKCNKRFASLSDISKSDALALARF